MKLDLDAHAATKLRTRAASLQAIRAAIEADAAAFRSPTTSGPPRTARLTNEERPLRQLGAAENHSRHCGRRRF